jgi:hypothetical protein
MSQFSSLDQDRGPSRQLMLACTEKVLRSVPLLELLVFLADHGRLQEKANGDSLHLLRTDQSASESLTSTQT